MYMSIIVYILTFVLVFNRRILNNSNNNKPAFTYGLYILRLPVHCVVVKFVVVHKDKQLEHLFGIEQWNICKKLLSTKMQKTHTNTHTRTLFLNVEFGCAKNEVHNAAITPK